MQESLLSLDLNSEASLQRLTDSCKKQKIIVLAGPTAVGKTRISIELAKQMNGEIVSADSMQVYRGMDIGTAKATYEEQQGIIHHMIDICDISETYNVKSFFDTAQEAFQSIFDRSKVPIVAGGTGFYIHSLIYGPPEGPGSDPSVRASLEKIVEDLGIEILYDRLYSLDPEYAKNITIHDAHKIVRALEIIEISGKKVSSFSWGARKPLPQYDFSLWFLDTPRNILYPRLEARCEQMLSMGFLDEVVQLDQKGLRRNTTASQAIGYKEALSFLEAGSSEKDYRLFVEKFKASSRHLAKRQLTWFRKEPGFQWLDMASLSDSEAINRIKNGYFPL